MGILVYRDRGAERDFVGRIDYERGSSASFRYDESYVARARAAGELGVSHRLPPDGEPYNADEIRPFFQGLLPEGVVLANLAEMYQVSRNDYLALLEQLGCESIGALTLVSEMADLADYEPHYDSLTAGAVDALRRDPVRAVTEATSATRLSLAGAQSKVAWRLPAGLDPSTAAIADWQIPRGTAPSTHIVKLARRGEERLAANEWACSELARGCGIEVATVAPLLDLPGAIAVERYDRLHIGAAGGEGEGVMRLHQEDFCQALGFPTYLKYQPEGGEGAYLAYCADLIDATCANPRAARIEFGKRLVFNIAVGNSDAHLKNSALLYNAAWTACDLAPLYDVTCIPLTGYSTQMPFVVGEHRRLADIDERDVMSIALDLGIGLGDFDEAVRQVVAGLESPKTLPADAALHAAADEILANAAQRIAVLKRYLGQ